jgi:Rad3-related DNA helicase
VSNFLCNELITRTENLSEAPRKVFSVDQRDTYVYYIEQVMKPGRRGSHLEVNPLLGELLFNKSKVICTSATLATFGPMLDAVYNIFLDHLPTYLDFRLLRQGDMNRIELVREFRESEGAVLRLKEALGHLLRTHEDRGLMTILDTRLHTKSYGTLVINALPPARRTENLKDLQRFFEENDNIPF